jgi:PEP-CTERM motif
MPLPARTLRAAILPTLAAVLPLLAPAAAHASGRAQAGVTLGLFSTWDLSADSSVTGTGWRDGVVVQTVNEVSDFPGDSIQVYDGVARARVEMQTQGTLLLGGGAPGLQLSGMRMVESDLEAGTLRLQSKSSYVAWPAPMSHRMASVAGYPFAEIIQGFDVRWAIGHAGPVEVHLTLTLDGTVLHNDGSDGWIAGLGVFLDLGNVATGLPPLIFPADPLQRFESSVSQHQISIGGSFINSQCHAAAGYCESWVNVYAGIDLRGRSVANGSFDYNRGANSDFDFGHTAQLALTSSPGVEILRVDNFGQVLPQYAWVNPPPVPEPGSALLLAAGLAGLAWRARRRA